MFIKIGRKQTSTNVHSTRRGHLLRLRLKNTPLRHAATSTSPSNSGALNSHNWKSPGRISMPLFGRLPFTLLWICPTSNFRQQIICLLKRRSHQYWEKGRWISELDVCFQFLAWAKSILQLGKFNHEVSFEFGAFSFLVCLFSLLNFLTRKSV